MSSQKDVPIARRTSKIPPQRRFKFVKFFIPLVSLLLLTLAGIFWAISWRSPETPAIAPPVVPVVIEKPTNDIPKNSILGHFAYAEAPAASLEVVEVASDGYTIKLRTAAAKSYQQMVKDAKADNIYLVAISGFRSQAEQRQLFFDISRQRNQTPAERAKVSAPAGYSEHHTGYAIDIGDRNVPEANLSPSFEQTPAFQWLSQNASRYSFELSFPQNNSQGVMYEPWHWRFVGDDDSLKTFYKKN